MYGQNLTGYKSLFVRPGHNYYIGKQQCGTLRIYTYPYSYTRLGRYLIQYIYSHTTNYITGLGASY